MAAWEEKNVAGTFDKDEILMLAWNCKQSWRWYEHESNTSDITRMHKIHWFCDTNRIAAWEEKSVAGTFDEDGILIFARNSKQDWWWYEHESNASDITQMHKIHGIAIQTALQLKSRRALLALSIKANSWFLRGILNKKVVQTLFEHVWQNVRNRIQIALQLERRRAVFALSTKTTSLFFQRLINKVEGGMNIIRTRPITAKCTKYKELQYNSHCSLRGDDPCGTFDEDEIFIFARACLRNRSWYEHNSNTSDNTKMYKIQRIATQIALQLERRRALLAVSTKAKSWFARNYYQIWR